MSDERSTSEDLRRLAREKIERLTKGLREAEDVGAMFTAIVALAHFQHPRSYFESVVLGQAREAEGDLDGAASAYHEAHFHQPDDAWVMLRLAELWTRLGRHPSVVRRVQRFAGRLLDAGGRPLARHAGPLRSDVDLLDSVLAGEQAAAVGGGDPEVNVEVMAGWSYTLGAILAPGGRLWPRELESYFASRRPTAERERRPEDALLDGYRRVIDPLLEPDEKWLLDIPVGFAWSFLAHSIACVQEDRAALVLFPGMFAGLWRANELAMGRPRGPDDRPSSIAHDLLRWGERSLEWLADRDADGADGEDKEIKTLSLLFAQIQQVFMLLHEYGHLAVIGQARREGRPRPPASAEDELAADAWAARRIAGGIPGVRIGDPLLIDQALLRLFLLLEVLARENERAGRRTRGDYPSPLRRWLTVCPILNGAPAMTPRDEQVHADLFRDAERRLFGA